MLVFFFWMAGEAKGARSVAFCVIVVVVVVGREWKGNGNGNGNGNLLVLSFFLKNGCLRRRCCPVPVSVVMVGDGRGCLHGMVLLSPGPPPHRSGGGSSSAARAFSSSWGV